MSHPTSLVVDAIGCQLIAPVPSYSFNLFNARYEHASTVLISNKGVEEWGYLGMAIALSDRAPRITVTW